MNIRVHAVTGDHKADRRNVQRGGAVGVGVAEIDRHQFLAFERQGVAIERLGDEEAIRQLPGKPSPSLLGSAALSSTVPWRTFRWYHGQRHYSGFYWSAT